jgi:GAF domain-containing protein
VSERAARTGGRSHGEYVRRLQEASQRHARELLAWNEELRRQVARLEAENERLADRVETQEREYASLEGRLARAEDDNRRAREEYGEVELRNASLANLYVATYQLHGSLDRAQVLTAIHEIVSDLVGSEEMAVFELDWSGNELVLVGARGVDPARYRRVPVEGGLLGRPVRTGEVYLAERDGATGARPEEARLTAAIPLKLEGRVTGVLAVFGLLPQKEGLGPLDGELFDLLSSQAAIALHCTRHHAGWEGAPTP